MFLIWCALSSHGFGHAAQVVPILNELGRRLPNVTVVLRTEIPASFFTNCLEIPWKVSPAKQDIGCIQQGPLKIDIQNTWDAHYEFHQRWAQCVQEESQVIRAHAPHLVLSNISHLAIEAGTVSGVPTIGLGSLSWDYILRKLGPRLTRAQTNLVAHIRRSYSKADLFIRLRPSAQVDAFPRVIDVGPIGSSLQKDEHVKHRIVGNGNQLLVLVGLGGVPLDGLPYEQLDNLENYRFVVDGHVPETCQRLLSLSTLQLLFKDVLAAADIVVTKPGYSTVIEAVGARKPIVYIRRYNFADEPPLVDYMHRFGQAVELLQEDFFSGNWKEALETVWALPPSHNDPPSSGIDDAVGLLMKFL